MYPKSPEHEVRERELIMNEKFNQYMRELSEENKDKIETIYQAHDIRQKIINLKNELISINERIKESNEVNLIYQKDAKIRELEELLVKAREK